MNGSFWHRFIPLHFFYRPASLISLSDCAPYFHIFLPSAFVSFLLSVVHFKHWHQIDSHVNKAAVGGQGPLPQALKLLPILFIALFPSTAHTHTQNLSHIWFSEVEDYTTSHFSVSEGNKPIVAQKMWQRIKRTLLGKKSQNFIHMGTSWRNCWWQLLTG